MKDNQQPSPKGKVQRLGVKAVGASASKQETRCQVLKI